MQATLTAAFAFAQAATPTVTAVMPSVTLVPGGTIVTLSGSGLSGSSSQVPEVSLAGLPCQVLQGNDTSLTCRAAAAQVT